MDLQDGPLPPTKNIPVLEKFFRTRQHVTWESI